MSNIISLSSNNTQITFQRQEDGYINATALCQNAGKQFGHYNANQTTQAFLKELQAEIGITITELMQIQKGGEPHLQGTWVHPQVATHLAQWLSPKFAVQVSKWLQDWIMKKQAPQIQQLSRLEILEIAIENERKVIALENTVEKQTQEIQVLEYSKATVERNLEIKAVEVKEKELVIEKAREVFVRVADGTGCYNFDALARNLQTPRKELRTLLETMKWICPKATDGKGNKILKPTALSERLGFTKYLTTKFVLPNGKAKMDFVITAKGYEKLLQQVGKVVK